MSLSIADYLRMDAEDKLVGGRTRPRPLAVEPVYHGGGLRRDGLDAISLVQFSLDRLD